MARWFRAPSSSLRSSWRSGLPVSSTCSSPLSASCHLLSLHNHLGIHRLRLKCELSTTTYHHLSTNPDLFPTHSMSSLFNHSFSFVFTNRCHPYTKILTVERFGFQRVRKWVCFLMKRTDEAKSKVYNTEYYGMAFRARFPWRFKWTY